MLMGHMDFVTVQISIENTQVQIHKPELIDINFNTTQ